jgi:hypothetical protein
VSAEVTTDHAMFDRGRKAMEEEEEEERKGLVCDAP